MTLISAPELVRELNRRVTEAQVVYAVLLEHLAEQEGLQAGVQVLSWQGKGQRHRYKKR
jgi:hypothetical protein